MTKTPLYEARISNEGLSALRKLLGISVSQIHSPALEVCDRFISSPSFSISLDGNGFLIVENSWLETPKEHIDYWQVSARWSQLPKDIVVGSVEGIENVMQFPVSAIHIQPGSRILRIAIHEAEWSQSDHEESVSHDIAVIFHREDGGRFCIKANESIADLLDFTRSEEEIELIVKENRCREYLE